MKMKKFFILLLFMLITIPQSFAYAIKVYDQWGNRIGTYRKEGENFVLYDFYDKKIENPQELIKNPPTQKTLSNYTQYFYDENMLPIGSYTTGLWSNSGRYYPRGRFLPRCFYQNYNRGIVRPGAKVNNILYEEKYPYDPFKHKNLYNNRNINIIQNGR